MRSVLPSEGRYSSFFIFYLTPSSPLTYISNKKNIFYKYMEDLQQQIDELLKRYQDGKTTAEEDAFLEELLFQKEADKDFLADIEALRSKKLAWDKLEAIHQIASKGSSARFFLKWNNRYSATAAAILLVLGFAIFFCLRLSSPTNDAQVAALTTSTDISPGGNKATLKLADGRTIALDNNQDGIVVGDRGISYADKEDSQLANLADEGKDLFLEVSTPKGGQYQVTLADGSRVWLNAGSTLRYPSRFQKDKRIVYLEGEAYFEVNEQVLSNQANHPYAAAQKKPFIVITKEQEAQVLGTKFNINSFDKQIKTTLASGRLYVSNAAGGAVTLWPNEQASSSANGITKRKINIESELAWRYDKFSFDNKPFAAVMEELARWYDLHIVYANRIPTIELAGDAHRNQNLSLVLRVLDASNVNYRLDKETRKLIIY